MLCLAAAPRTLFISLILLDISSSPFYIIYYLQLNLSCL
nr:MAG TPA: hypothetical protein [Caudoviricetes sp.]